MTEKERKKIITDNAGIQLNAVNDKFKKDKIFGQKVVKIYNRLAGIIFESEKDIINVIDMVQLLILDAFLKNKEKHGI